MDKPVLYSFRRCPYAMRARLALTYAGIHPEHREIALKDKPAHMLQISPKGTVPVLWLPDGTVLEESFDIMLWALRQNDPEQWLDDDLWDKTLQLVQENDGDFKQALDRYKYPDRYPELSQANYRLQGEMFLAKLETLLQQHKCLLSDRVTLADMAIFPFVRQFAHVDRGWFFHSAYPKLIAWLTQRLESELFTGVMIKQPLWKEK